MEGAARSGRMAALAIVKTSLNLDATADPTQPEDTLNDPAFIQIPNPV
jgi:hypothetical protein